MAGGETRMLTCAADAEPDDEWRLGTRASVRTKESFARALKWGMSIDRRGWFVGSGPWTDKTRPSLPRTFLRTINGPGGTGSGCALAAALSPVSGDRRDNSCSRKTKHLALWWEKSKPSAEGCWWFFCRRRRRERKQRGAPLPRRWGSRPGSPLEYCWTFLRW